MNLVQNDETEIPDGPAAVRVIPWLRCNLGREVVAMLTGTDVAALHAVVQVAELYQRVRQDKASQITLRLLESDYKAECAMEESLRIAQALGHCVRLMQPECRELAYHSLAMVGEWSDREMWWREAGLGEISRPMRCKHEPKGRA